MIGNKSTSKFVFYLNLLKSHFVCLFVCLYNTMVFSFLCLLNCTVLGSESDSSFENILKQWIVVFALSDWLLNQVISCTTPRENVYACARLSISGLSHTCQSDQSLPRALGFILCAACGSVALLHAARIFGYFVVTEIVFIDNQAQITETASRLDSEKVS